MSGEGSNRTAFELDRRTSYSTCKRIENLDPSSAATAKSHPSSPDLIPESEPDNIATLSHGETGSSEEDLASVPSTVQVSTPGNTDDENEPSTYPSRSPGGT
jgi:hypothetical protein